jgi:GNAT superfamily N-acetyltransferase
VRLLTIHDHGDLVVSELIGVARLDPALASYDVLERVHAIRRCCHVEANPVEPFMCVADLSAFLRYPPASEPRRYWLASGADEIVGFAQLAPIVGSPVADASILVLPEWRRRGAGAALLAAVTSEARANGCTTLTGSYATDAGQRFAASVGASPTRRDIRSVLLLAQAEVEAFAVPGYQLRSWNGRAPNDLVESFAEAREAINDAPAAAEDEWHAWDVEKVRDLERVIAQRGRQIRVTVAVDDAGTVVAYTELRVSTYRDAIATTEDTAVRAAHRRHGLALSVKSEALRRLRDERTDVTLVGATNAESNLAMLAINRRLGFKAVAAFTGCALPLGRA